MASAAASRVRVSSVPVSTKVFPANSDVVATAGAGAGQVNPAASSRSTMEEFSGSRK